MRWATLVGLLLLSTAQCAQADVMTHAPPGAGTLRIRTRHRGPVVPPAVGSRLAGVPAFSRVPCGATAVLRSPSGRYLLFQRARRRPGLWVEDTATGRTRLWQRGACGAAWGADGDIAYVQLHEGRLSDYGDPVGHVEVRVGLDGAATRWTGRHAWRAPVWAGGHLLVQRGRSGELAILDAPGVRRSVDGEAHRGPMAQSSRVVAVSPDGTRALLAGQCRGQPSCATLLRVGDNTILDTLDLRVFDPRAEADWVGPRVLLSPGGGALVSHPTPELKILRIAGNALRLARDEFFKRGGAYIMGSSLTSVDQPRFLDSTGRAVGGWFDQFDHVGFMVCRLPTHRCTVGREPGGAPRRRAVLAANPSRP